MAACGAIIIILIFLFFVLVIWNEGHQNKKFMLKHGMHLQSKIFDYSAANKRLKELQELYWRCEQLIDPDGTWDWYLQYLIDSTNYDIDTAKRQPCQVANC